MLRPRLIPCLLVDAGALVKTVRFGSPKYVGDPINAVRIFNEKEVDELAVFDISATRTGREPDYGLIKRMAAECRMPLCYGGGVGNPEQIERIISLGVEKVAMSSAAVANPQVIGLAARRVGAQSVVAVMDVRAGDGPGTYEVYTRNGTAPAGIDAVACARMFEEHGAGEVVVNSIDNDGVMKGYDLDLAQRVREAVTVPMTVLGGAGCLNDIARLFDRVGIVGAAAGSLFVFKGKYSAVLINYPRRAEKDALYRGAAA